jgi:hypothetical protein
MGHALLHSPARQAARGDGRVLGRTRAGIWVVLGMRSAGGGVSSVTPPQALTKNKANNRRPIDGRLLSKETR